MQYKREILDSIRRILRSLRNSSRAAESELGLSGAQLLVLQLLKTGKPLSINELAEGTQTHQSSVSVVVSKLVESELVRRSSSPEDGRRVEIALTSAGSRLLAKKAPKLAQERLFSAIGNLPESKQKLLAALLQQIVDDAGFAAEPATLFFEDDEKEKRK
ncbi:MAG: MarR family transcriptional regulator [Proteobacteria bacterium]|nr:MAG: MarR family transcriptional regulator [Pseudomonadota bacterium]